MDQYMREMDSLFTIAKVTDEVHKINYFRNGLPADIAADLNLDPKTGREFATLRRQELTRAAEAASGAGSACFVAPRDKSGIRC